MIDGRRVIAIIPARGGSKGLPGKNVRDLFGKPLIAWSIEQARASRYVDRVLVSTDSQTIADAATKHGAEVPFLRPAALSNDTASSIDVTLHALDQLAASGDVYDYIILLEPTSPLRDVEDIDGAMELLARHATASSIVGVVKAEASHPAFLFAVRSGLLEPMQGASPSGVRRQDLSEAFYYLEGTVYISDVVVLREQRSFYHAATAPWIVERYKAVEIDELPDLIVAEALMKAKHEGLLQ
jgi:N-acylneuraminate cytidylyltransferase/CMP-N,N'-diacetyllegionaminic acid synthase